MSQPNEVHVVSMTDIAEAFGFHASQGASVHTLHITAFDFYRLKLDEGFRFYFDPETSRKVLRKGVVGYCWGANVVLSTELKRGEILVTQAEAATQEDSTGEDEVDAADESEEELVVSELSDPTFVAQIAVARVRKMGGYFGLEEKQTDDLADDLRAFLNAAADTAEQLTAQPATV